MKTARLLHTIFRARSLSNGILYSTVTYFQSLLITKSFAALTAIIIGLTTVAVFATRMLLESH